MPLWMCICIIMTGIIILIIWASCRVAGNADRQMDKMAEPHLTFADTDISDTIETLLGRPGVISMSTKEGQEFHVKTNKLHNDAGQEYSGIGSATIIVIPEDV